MLWGDGDERMIINDLNDIKETYGLIYADPPWKQSKGGKKSVRENSSGKPLDYPTCSLDEIKEHLRLATESTTENSILFLWTIDKYLFEAQQIAESLVRYGHEYLLYMYKGKLTPVAKDERGKVHTVFRERVTKHSKKPDIAYEIIERLYPNLKKLEMYARETRDGWDSFGNEVA